MSGCCPFGTAYADTDAPVDYVFRPTTYNGLVTVGWMMTFGRIGVLRFEVGGATPLHEDLSQGGRRRVERKYSAGGFAASVAGGIAL